MNNISPPIDPLHPTYNTQNRGAQAEYLAKVKVALRNCVKDINLADPVQMKRVLRDLMIEVSYKAQNISSNHIVQINPLYFEWDKFILTLERQFPDVLNEMVNCDHQWHLSDQNKSRSTISRNGEPYYPIIAPSLQHSIHKPNSLNDMKQQTYSSS